MDLIVSSGFIMTAVRCSLVGDSLNGEEHHDRMAAGAGFDDWR
jgi:hypothetical protein